MGWALPPDLGAALVQQCYTPIVPTARARHSITETAAIAQALDDAALVWPDLRHDRAELLRRLVLAGHSAVAVDRRALVRASAGAVSGVYPANAAAALRTEWPE